MTPATAAIVALGERRLRERRIAVPGDLTTQLVNRITADRDQLREDNRRLRQIIADYAALADKAVYAHGERGNEE